MPDSLKDKIYETISLLEFYYREIFTDADCRIKVLTNNFSDDFIVVKSFNLKHEKVNILVEEDESLIVPNTVTVCLLLGDKTIRRFVING